MAKDNEILQEIKEIPEVLEAVRKTMKSGDISLEEATKIAEIFKKSP